MESKKIVEKEKEYCKVSVIINVFNGEKYIKKAIESIEKLGGKIKLTKK